LRNLRQPVEIIAAVRQGGTGRGRLVIDPVCRMAVDPDRAAGRLTVDDTAFFFCSLDCAGAFAREPGRFIG
jgi:YHS domain-containing protein